MVKINYYLDGESNLYEMDRSLTRDEIDNLIGISTVIKKDLSDKKYDGLVSILTSDKMGAKEAANVISNVIGSRYETNVENLMEGYPIEYSLLHHALLNKDGCSIYLATPNFNSSGVFVK